MKIQDTIHGIIKYSREAGLRYISKQQIIAEAKKTPLGMYAKEYYDGSKVSKLERKVDQAIRELHKAGKIKQRGQGKWTIDNDTRKYRPVICRHIRKQGDRWYCPVKHCYIGDPRRQCELIHATSYGKFTKIVYPMCPGYIDKKSTVQNRAESLRLIQLKEKKDDEARRYYNHNPRDPLSKQFMPKLYGNEKVD